MSSLELFGTGSLSAGRVGGNKREVKLMQRGMRPFRVVARDGTARDLEAEDQADARIQAAKNLVAGAVGIKSVHELPADIVRRYKVKFVTRVQDELVPILHDLAPRGPVRAKSSVEAVKIANAEIESGIVPDAGLMQALVRAVDAVPVTA